MLRRQNMRDEKSSAAVHGLASIDPRVPLALERTFLAWIRTGLAMMGFGFVVARFALFLRELERMGGAAAPHGRGLSAIMGTAMVALGVCVTAYSAFSFRSRMKSLDRGGSPVAPGETVPMLISLTLCLIGLGTVAYLMFMP